MPTEDSEKGKIFYINKYGEYKELGEVKSLKEFGIAAKEAGKAMEDFAFEAEISIPVQFKKYKRKRFKKLLMARGIQRNEAELYSRIFPRIDFFLGT